MCEKFRNRGRRPSHATRGRKKTNKEEATGGEGGAGRGRRREWGGAHMLRRRTRSAWRHEHGGDSARRDSGREGKLAAGACSNVANHRADGAKGSPSRGRITPRARERFSPSTVSHEEARRVASRVTCMTFRCARPTSAFPPLPPFSLPLPFPSRGEPVVGTRPLERFPSLAERSKRAFDLRALGPRVCFEGWNCTECTLCRSLRGNAQCNGGSSIGARIANSASATRAASRAAGSRRNVSPSATGLLSRWRPRGS